MSSSMGGTVPMLDKTLKSFEDLIRRSVAPTVTIFVVALMVDLLGAELSGQSVRDRFNAHKQVIGNVALVPSPGVGITLTVLLIIGLSYALAAVQQVVFDNRLKANFGPMGLPCHLQKIFRPRFKPHKKSCAGRAGLQRQREKQSLHACLKPDILALRRLRKAAASRLRELGLDGAHKARVPTDYILYEILGGIDPTDTRPFVDSAKAMGIFFVSVILVLVGNALFAPELRLGCRLVFLALAVLSYRCGYNVTAAQYRARAIRLYVNILTMPMARVDRLLNREARGASSGERTSS
jgi:hypothetical protein